MAELIEIRWHGRGGQGAKTAATFLAAAAIKEGKYSQGFPEYGPERMGAPMKGFTRISEEPIKLHCAIYTPDVVIVLDPTLLDVVDVGEGLKEDGVIIVNSPKPPAEIRKKLEHSGSFVSDGRKIYTVDATKIALDELGRAIPNTPMIGALTKVKELISLDVIVEDIREKFAAKFSEKVIEGNVKAIKRAYQEVRGE